MLAPDANIACVPAVAVTCRVWPYMTTLMLCDEIVQLADEHKPSSLWAVLISPNQHNTYNTDTVYVRHCRRCMSMKL